MFLHCRWYRLAVLVCTLWQWFVTVAVLVGPLLLDRFRRQCLLQQAVVGIEAVVPVMIVFQICFGFYSLWFVQVSVRLVISVFSAFPRSLIVVFSGSIHVANRNVCTR